MSIFAKNVIKLTIGNVTAQVISLAAIPIITRIYSPSNYGVFGIYLSITTILFYISTFHFHRTIMLPVCKNDAINLLGLSLLSVIAFSLLLALVVILINLFDLLPKIWFKEGIRSYICFVPLGVLVQGCALSFSFWAIRSKMFTNMAIARVTESITDRGIVLGFGFFSHTGAIGLIGGRIVGPLVAQCYLVQRAFSNEIKLIWKSLSFTEMKRLSLRYREFHVFSALSMLVSRSSTEIPFLLIAFFFLSKIAGFYALAMRVTNMPMMLVGDAISNVLLQRVTEDPLKGQGLAMDTIRLFGYLIYLILPPTLILMIFGEILFGIVFGSEWSDAGTLAQILSLSFLFTFLYRPLSVLFDAFERQKQRFVFTSLLLFMSASTIIGAKYISGSIHIVLLSLVAITCVIYAIIYFYLFGLLRVSARRVLVVFVSKIAVLTPLIFGLPLSKFLLHKSHMIAAILLICLIIMQGFIVLSFEPLLKKEVVSLFVVVSNKIFNRGKQH
ncbi:hypothetical protein C6A37_01590 [Desulfobacteraceae bacterium SEEP-SAG9]|nr:hypothetical protein C6A37_01590 [Desulfobacteraceae bacterium SEEP-SAG9]